LRKQAEYGKDRLKSQHDNGQLIMDSGKLTMDNAQWTMDKARFTPRCRSMPTVGMGSFSLSIVHYPLSIEFGWWR
jgi:hypothetical protein